MVRVKLSIAEDEKSKAVVLKYVLMFFLFASPALSFTNAAYGSSFDYSIYDSLLEKYVSSGKVDYLSWRKNDRQSFSRYIESLEDVSLAGWGEDEKKAFWINAYNALTIYAVLKYLPQDATLSNTFSVHKVRGFFDKITYRVAGEDLTLNDIENEKLRAAFGDPRIHFAIVCASRSCPRLENTSFKPQGLEVRLDKAARQFINDQKRNRLAQRKRILYLSKIFRWFAGDFINHSGSVLNFLRQFINKEDAEYLNNSKVRIKYLNYNWLVNIKQGGGE